MINGVGDNQHKASCRHIHVQYFTLEGKVIASATLGVVHMAAMSIASDTGNVAVTVSQEKVCVCVCVCVCMYTVLISQQQQLCTCSIHSHTSFVLF